MRIHYGEVNFGLRDFVQVVGTITLSKIAPGWVDRLFVLIRAIVIDFVRAFEPLKRRVLIDVICQNIGIITFKNKKTF
jgi:hypothetical protein